jgi:hypothetical protein
MRKIAFALAAAAFVIGGGLYAWKAEAMTGTAASNFATTAKNYSPIVKQTGCKRAAFCPPGFVWTCRPFKCKCRPCW